MTVNPAPHEVRQLVERVFASLGATRSSLRALDETILFSDGRYTARSYRVARHSAMWLIAAGIVQVYDADGQMLQTINLFDRTCPQRLAA